MRVAYADPPYPGQAKRHYGKNGDPYQGVVEEVDHAELIEGLERDQEEFMQAWHDLWYAILSALYIDRLVRRMGLEPRPWFIEAETRAKHRGKR